MPVAFITVKLPDGSLVHLDVDLNTRIEEFRSILAPKSGVKRHKQRLVFNGRLLQDGRSLDAYGVERNSTIFLLHGQAAGGDGPDGIDISSIPNQLGALQRHVLQNPDILQQMLESPAMQSLLNDHDFMRSLLKMDPRLKKLFDSSPELGDMLHDVDFMRQATEALRNPVHVRDVLRSTDRSMTQLEELHGGAFDVLRSMCQDIRRPLLDAEYTMPAAPKKSKKAKAIDEAKEMLGEIDEDDGEERAMSKEAGSIAEDGEDGTPPPDWLGSFDTNAMASMMQDQNMQHLLAQLVQTMPGPTVKPHPDDPFLDSGFIGQMFHAQTITSMCKLQDAVAKLSMTAEPAAGGGKETKGKKAGSASSKSGANDDPSSRDGQSDSPAVLSGLNAKSPAADYKASFALFLAAEAESPEVRYKGQLQAMGNMGFTDKEACIQALHQHDGNMTKAVESLMVGKN